MNCDLDGPVKVCNTCHIIKSRDDFYRNRASPDGYLNVCKKCDNHRRARAHQRDWPRRICKASLQHDISYGRVVVGEFVPTYIDEAWCVEQVRLQGSRCARPDCLGATRELLYGVGVNRTTNPAGLTIQRDDNALAHIKSNCCYYHKKCQYDPEQVAASLAGKQAANLRR